MGDGPHQLVGPMPPPNGGGPCSSSGFCFLFMGDGLPPIGGGMGPTKWWGPMQLKWALLPVHGWWAPPNGGEWAPPNSGGPCSSSGLCFLFMGDGLPPIGGGQWRSQYEARGGNYLFLNCLIDNDFHRRSQHEARGGSCLLLNFQIDNDFASCFAISNKNMIQISTNYHKLVFVLKRCTTKTLRQLCSIHKFPRG